MRMVDARSRLRLPLFHPKFSSKSKLPKADDEYGQPSSSRSQRSLHDNNNNNKNNDNNNDNDNTPRDNEDNRRTAAGKPAIKTSPRKSGRREERRRTEPEMIEDKEARNKNGGRFNDVDAEYDKGSGSEDRDVIGGDDVQVTSSETRKKARNDVQKKGFSIRKWRQKRVEHNDDNGNNDCVTTAGDNNNNDNHDKDDDEQKKTQSGIRFKYHSSLHYGSVVRTKSRAVSSLPSGLRSLSFYSRLPRRQPRVEPLGDKTGKTRTKRKTRGEAGKTTVTSSEEKADDGRSSANDKGLKDEEGDASQDDESVSESRRGAAQEKSASIGERDEDEVQKVQKVKEMETVLSNGHPSASFNELEMRSVGSDDDVEEHETRVKEDKKKMKKMKKKKMKKREEKVENISEEYADDFEDDDSSLKS